VRIFAVLIILFFVSPARGDVLAQLRPGQSAVVIEVVDGDTVVLDHRVDGARQVRLVGLQAPKLPLGRAGFKEWPLAADSRSALMVLTLNQTVRLAFGGSPIDRHGRLLAHLFLKDGTWVQGKMLSSGMARVYTFADNRSLAPEMYRLENSARKSRVGIWSHPFYAVRAATPERLEALTGTFQIVEGIVVDAVHVKARTYLNFSRDWRTDFTASINGKSLRLFKGSNFNPLSLKGKSVRIRGWIKNRNGPMIDLTHPEQIEVISE